MWAFLLHAWPNKMSCFRADMWNQLTRPHATYRCCRRTTNCRRSKRAQYRWFGWLCARVHHTVTTNINSHVYVCIQWCVYKYFTNSWLACGSIMAIQGTNHTLTLQCRFRLKIKIFMALVIVCGLILIWLICHTTVLQLYITIIACDIGNSVIFLRPPPGRILNFLWIPYLLHKVCAYWYLNIFTCPHTE